MQPRTLLRCHPIGFARMYVGGWLYATAGRCVGLVWGFGRGVAFGGAVSYGSIVLALSNEEGRGPAWCRWRLWPRFMWCG